MPSTNKLQSDLIATFPNILFETSDDFRWLPARSIVQFDPSDQHLPERLLHEVAHSLLKHVAYSRDIELIGMERDAWHYAKNRLAPQFDIHFSDIVIDDDMDTYRDWLHARSCCPRCTATGIQTAENLYNCLSCGSNWKVNRAIGCQLRRYEQK